MKRSKKKGIFIDYSLFLLSRNIKRKKAKTRSRSTTIIPELVDKKIFIYNGKRYIPKTITIDMVGHKLGEFSYTRKRVVHKTKKKKWGKK